MHIALMQEPKHRLRAARKAAGYATAADAARALKMAYGTYAGHENGSRGLLRAMDRYAAAFSVRAEWLRTAQGPMRSHGKTEFDVWLNRLSPEKQQQALEYIKFLAKSEEPSPNAVVDASYPASGRRIRN